MTGELTTGWLAPALLALYYGILGILAAYGVHRLLLVVLYVRHRRDAPPVPAAEEEWPRVTVQLPLYNEMYVVRRLIDAVCRLDYPCDRLEIQVLDDSDDETAAVAAAEVARQRARGFAIHHLRRDDRAGFKAGALAAGLERAEGELIAVFDADFVPPPEFLRAAVPHFADPAVGMVQGRWGHLNRDYSLLTRVQALLLDGHFVVEHAARHRAGCFFNFNGTAGIWRRRAIVDAGGWQHDTLTEDLDLSYRAQLAGWRFVYLPELLAPAELPVDVDGFKGQQYRWAKGSIQTARKLLGPILAAPLPARVRFEAFVHLTNNVSYPLMVALSLLVFPAMVLRRGSSTTALLAIDLPLFLAATLSVLVFYLASQLAGGGPWRPALRRLPALMGIGIGLSLNNARAVVAGLRERGGTFHRTPKYSIVHRGEDWRRKRYRAGRSALVVFEGLFALYFAACSAYALWAGMWASLPFLYLFLQGYGTIFLLAVLPRLRRPPLRSLIAPMGSSWFSLAPSASPARAVGGSSPSASTAREAHEIHESCAAVRAVAEPPALQ
jgi:cellulose synthase/poly-beta-1,6-N-acetylglucosamine synthase-like glycosyltransferase